MSEPPSKTRSLLERLSHFISHEPDTREQLLDSLQEACTRDVIDADCLSMIEGVLNISERCARDVMIPRSQVHVIQLSDSKENLLAIAEKTGHSRFPVYEKNKDHIVGILLAKDLLRYYAKEAIEIKKILRPAVFIPESKRLNVLLRDFRVNKNHMAIVVDEYSNVAGIVTIEDILEQIVGDIADEFDSEDEQDNILRVENGGYRVLALTEVEQFNRYFGTLYSDENADTIGGLLVNHLGRMPKRGENIILKPMSFEVLRADARQVHTLLVNKSELSSV